VTGETAHLDRGRERGHKYALTVTVSPGSWLAQVEADLSRGTPLRCAAMAAGPPFSSRSSSCGRSLNTAVRDGAIIKNPCNIHMFYCIGHSGRALVPVRSAKLLFAPGRVTQPAR
jgi:hypothetical protein